MEIDVETGPATGGSETVLVVEDDEDVRTTVVDMISDLGYRVLKAKNAESGLAIIESGVPLDLLFTNVVMPGNVRSTELARKARERLPNIAVLFTSGYTENAIVHGGRLDEGVDLLSKPYSRDALARKIRHVLRDQQQRNLTQGLALRSAGKPQNDLPQPPRLRVLLVEDDDMVRSLTADMVVQLGHYVAEAKQASEALDRLDRHAFDVLLTDIALPGLTGDELALRAVPQHPNLRVVFASGYDAIPKWEELSAVLLRKPYNLVSLGDALKAAMSHASGPSD
jgi:CheY-like chemotaxis protein